MTSSEILSLLLYIVFCLQVVIFGGGFFYYAWKDTQPVKARSKVLMFGRN